MSDRLSKKQLLFCDEYLVDTNGKEAAIRAGYAPGSAKVLAARNLKNPAIAAIIQAKMDERSEKTGITAEYVLEGLQTVAERCLQREAVMIGHGEERKQLKDDETGEGVWKFDAAGANKSLELLGKHLKLFADRVEHNHTFDLADRLMAARERIK